MTAISISILDGVPDQRWNAYVDAHPDGTFFHRSEWADVYTRLAWTKPGYLLAERSGNVVGIMPLAHIRWRPGGEALVSAPYCVEAGALGDDSAVRVQLENAAVAQMHAQRVRFLEVRQSGISNTDWYACDHFSSYSRTLADDDATNLQAVPRKQRAMIRKGEAAGLESGTAIDLAMFYALYARSVRDLGTPVYAAHLFSAIVACFGTHVGLFAVTSAGAPIAAVMSFYYRGRVMPYYAGAVPRARELKAYDFLYWALMCDAVARGCQVFDFGRSVTGSGAAAFKKNWGFTARPLSYQFVTRDNSPPQALDPDSPFNRLARRAWTHMPLSVSNRIGPLLSRRLY